MIRPLLWVMISGMLWTHMGSQGAVISVKDSNVLNGLTPYNWVAKNDFISSTVGGASLKLGFNDTKQVALQLDNSHLVSLPASRYPIICWSVNGGSMQTHQLAKAESSVLLATGVTNPVIDLYIKGMSPYEDRYTGDLPLNSVKITEFVIDPGGSTVTVPHFGKVWLNIGDSILSGDAAGYAAGQGGRPRINGLPRMRLAPVTAICSPGTTVIRKPASHMADITGPVDWLMCRLWPR